MERADLTNRVCPRCGECPEPPAERCPRHNLDLVRDPNLDRLLGGRYRVLRLLAVGGMGSVYIARHEVLGRNVAVKLLSRHLGADRHLRQRFLREATAPNRVRHENIVDVIDFGTDAGDLYLVMELLEGEHLAARTARGPLSLDDALEVLLAVAKALSAAHKAGLVHRDIKPENIFLLRVTGPVLRVKVLDFGLVRISSARMTASGEVFGTPMYMSPEQTQGREATPASDVFSLGAVFYEMLTGSRPFTGTSGEMLNQRPSVTPLPVPAVPREVEALVHAMMEADPARRIPDGQSLREQVEQLRATLGARGLLVRGSREPGRPPTLQDWLQRRAALHQRLVGNGDPGALPEPLRRSLSELDEALEEIPALERETQEVARELTALEEHHHGQRRAFENALGELARDFDGWTEPYTEAQRALEAAREAVNAHASASLDAWRAALRCAPPHESLDDPGLAALEHLGERAAAWRSAQRALDEAAERFDAIDQERRDLSFQIATIRATRAEAEVRVASSRASLRQRLGDLGARLAARHAVVSQETQRLESAPARP
ncbi:MAG: protein kinase [Deltaproteobacteria bacterium]|nr:protein kinase [Deltaproteobacteria bacterium]